MEQWNNVELADLSKKSYTLNHAYDGLHPKEENVNSDKTNANANDNEINQVNTILQPGSDIKPKVQLEEVESLVRRLYGITTSEIKELISYDDRNYFIKEDGNIKNPLIINHWPHGYVLKILNALDSQKINFVDAQNQLLLYLSKQNVQCPRPIANASGNYYSLERINGSEHVVRLLEFIPGKMIHQVELTNNLLYQSGEYLAKIDRALLNFTHEGYESHKTLWMLQSVPQLRDFIYVLEDHDRKLIIEEVLDAFESKVLNQLATLEVQVIHGDFNEQNVVVTDGGEDNNNHRVSGLIDFGDTNKSPLIFEIGIALTYVMLQAKSLESGGIFLAGYEAVQPISATEKSLLKYCVAARLAQSLVLGIYTHSVHPNNDYVLVTQDQGWQLIAQLWRENFENIDELWEKTGTKYLTQSSK